jgi:hypothetical protein
MHKTRGVGTHRFNEGRPVRILEARKSHFEPADPTHHHPANVALQTNVRRKQRDRALIARTCNAGEYNWIY